AEDALRESQQRLSGILDSAMDSVITVDEQQRIILFNAAAERMFLCPQADALGKPIEAFIPERFRAAHAHHIHNFSETGMTSRAMGGLGSLWARRSNGEEFQIEASISQVESRGRKLFTVILRDVTDRIRAEDTMRESQQRLSGILDSAMDSIITVDEEQHIVLFNAAAERMFLCSQSNALGRSIEEFIPERFRAAHAHHIHNFSDTGMTSRAMGGLGSLWARRSNGEEFQIEASISQVESRGRKLFTVILRDVTDRLQAEESLRRQAEELACSQRSLEEKTLMLQSVLDSMCEGLVAVDENGEFVLWNPAAEKIVGLGPSQVPAEGWTNHYGLFLPDGMTPLRSEENPLAIAITGHVNTAVLFVRNKEIPDGAFLEVFASPIRDQSGAARRAVSAFRDITQRKQAEEKLRQSEERFAKAFQSSPLAIALSTIAKGQFVDVNEAFLKMLGYAADEVVGRTEEELGIWAIPAQRIELFEKLRQAGRVTLFEAQLKTKSGETRTVNLAVEPIILDGRECILTTGSDVTETKSLERQLHQSLKMEALGQLTGGIAHDFNNLLGVVVGNLDLLERIVAWNEAAVKRVQAAQRAATRGAELTRRLLAFSRTEQLNPASVAMPDIIREVVELASRAIGPEIKISTQCDADLQSVFVDSAGLETALLNLALNARDAMPKGGSLILRAQIADLSNGNALVQAGDLKPGRYARVTVSDSGHGMPREIADRAFEPFFTTKPRDKGTGLGLAMVYGFVKHSGGAIRLYSEVGYGTTVSLYLPLATEAPDAVLEPEPVEAPERVGGTALLVDDEADLLEIADAYLGELGYTVIRAHNSVEALATLERAGHIDLLVTDIIMPGKMNGIELAQRVRELRPGIKVIFTSRFPAEALADRSGKPEGGPLLHKPYQRAEFADIVRKH